jgi:hypothetical protein
VEYPGDIVVVFRVIQLAWWMKRLLARMVSLVVLGVAW